VLLLQVLDEGNNLCPIHSCKDSAQGVSDLMYSPNNRFMAASTYDTWIDIYKCVCALFRLYALSCSVLTALL